jgi:hypothetical protein
LVVGETYAGAGVEQAASKMAATQPVINRGIYTLPPLTEHNGLLAVNESTHAIGGARTILGAP